MKTLKTTEVVQMYKKTRVVQMYTNTTRELMKKLALLLETKNWQNVVIQNLHLSWWGDVPCFTSVTCYKREDISLDGIYCRARAGDSFLLDVEYIEEIETILINLIDRHNAENMTDED